MVWKIVMFHSKQKLKQMEMIVDPSVGVEGVPNGVVNGVCPCAPKRLADGDGVTGVEKGLNEDGAKTGVAKVEKSLDEVVVVGFLLWGILIYLNITDIDHWKIIENAYEI
jgi:hypothetical protein